jgi:peroxiredoxin
MLLLGAFLAILTVAGRRSAGDVRKALSEERALAVGQTAPDFTLPRGTETVALSSMRGRRVLLYFWMDLPGQRARKEQEKFLEDLAAKTSERARLLVISPSRQVGGRRDDLIDPKSRVARRYRAFGPKLVMVDEQGKIRYAKYAHPKVLDEVAAMVKRK